MYDSVARVVDQWRQSKEDRPVLAALLLKLFVDTPYAFDFDDQAPTWREVHNPKFENGMVADDKWQDAVYGILLAIDGLTIDPDDIDIEALTRATARALGMKPKRANTLF